MTHQEFDKPFTVDELRVWAYRDDYFVEVLNGEKSLDEAREDLASFRHTEYYTGNDPELRTTITGKEGGE